MTFLLQKYEICVIMLHRGGVKVKSKKISALLGILALLLCIVGFLTVTRSRMMTIHAAQETETTQNTEESELGNTNSDEVEEPKLEDVGSDGKEEPEEEGDLPDGEEEIEVPKGKNYTISTKTKPCKRSLRKSYNKYTKHYYTFRSYLEILEKKGGGTLRVKKGTYTITNTLYVPSNVTIVFEDGVTIKKGNKTGKRKLKASDTIFQLVSPSVVKKKKKLKAYQGGHDISLIGQGNVVIDMRHVYTSIAIVMGHDKNIMINNITFKNMSAKGHLIELNSSNNVTVKNCEFIGNVTSGNKEAINVDSTDKNTKGFNNSWSSHDRTTCDGVTIERCYFRKLPSGVGTHKYSYKNGKQQYHKNITVKDCQFLETGNQKEGSSSVRMMNWKDANVSNNQFLQVAYFGISAYAVDNPVISYNRFSGMSYRAIVICSWKNKGSGSSYPRSYVYNLDLNKVLNNHVEGDLKSITYYQNGGSVSYPMLIENDIL